VGVFGEGHEKSGKVEQGGKRNKGEKGKRCEEAGSKDQEVTAGGVEREGIEKKKSPGPRLTTRKVSPLCLSILEQTSPRGGKGADAEIWGKSRIKNQTDRHAGEMPH